MDPGYDVVKILPRGRYAFPHRYWNARRSGVARRGRHRFAPVRQEGIDQGYTEEEINESIDAAVAAVRHDRT